MAKVIVFICCILCMPNNFSSAFLMSQPFIHRPSPVVLTTSSTSIMTLEKPLGLLLEEIEESTPNGVKIQDVSEGGSAYRLPNKTQLVGCKILRIMGDDVSSVFFEDVMNKLVNAPSPVTIEIELPGTLDTDNVDTTVMITVLQEGKDEAIFEAKVGDNLRKTLLDNNIELYRGLKKKIGNCGGGGQCTFCAIDMVESQGWAPRSDYENQKISKWPNARLACLTNIQGPCKIRIQ